MIGFRSHDAELAEMIRSGVVAHCGSTSPKCSIVRSHAGEVDAEVTADTAAASSKGSHSPEPRSADQRPAAGRRLPTLTRMRPWSFAHSATWKRPA